MFFHNCSMVEISQNGSVEEESPDNQLNSSSKPRTLRGVLDELSGPSREPAHSPVDPTVFTRPLPGLSLAEPLQKLLDNIRHKHDPNMSPLPPRKDNPVFIFDNSKQELPNSEQPVEARIEPISDKEFMTFMSVESIRESEIPYDRIQETINRMQLKAVTPELVVIMAVLESEGLDITPIWDQIAEDGSIIPAR